MTATCGAAPSSTIPIRNHISGNIEPRREAGEGPRHGREPSNTVRDRSAGTHGAPPTKQRDRSAGMHGASPAKRLEEARGGQERTVHHRPSSGIGVQACTVHHRPSGWRRQEEGRNARCTTDQAAGSECRHARCITGQAAGGGKRRAGTHGPPPTKQLEEGRSARCIADRSTVGRGSSNECRNEYRNTRWPTAHYGRAPMTPVPIHPEKVTIGMGIQVDCG
jgi:hypothetical protein